MITHYQQEINDSVWCFLGMIVDDAVADADLGCQAKPFQQIKRAIKPVIIFGTLTVPVFLAVCSCPGLKFTLLSEHSQENNHGDYDDSDGC